MAVGSNTVLVDNPKLTARMVYRERPLTRVIFDRRRRVSRDARVFSTLEAGPVIMIEEDDLPETAGLRVRVERQRKLADYQKDVEARLERKRNLPTVTDDPVRDTFLTGFEPGEKASFGTPENFVVVPSMGIAGPHVALLDGATMKVDGYDDVRFSGLLDLDPPPADER